MRRVCVVSCLIFCAVLLLGHQSRAAAHKLFGNMTYLTDSPYIVERVTLVNGERVTWKWDLTEELIAIPSGSVVLWNILGGATLDVTVRVKEK